MCLRFDTHRAPYGVPPQSHIWYDAYTSIWMGAKSIYERLTITTWCSTEYICVPCITFCFYKKVHHHRLQLQKMQIPQQHLMDDRMNARRPRTHLLQTYIARVKLFVFVFFFVSALCWWWCSNRFRWLNANYIVFRFRTSTTGIYKLRAEARLDAAMR